MKKPLLAAALVALVVNTTLAGNAPVEPKVEEFPLSAVRLNAPSPFTKAMQIDRTDGFPTTYSS